MIIFLFIRAFFKYSEYGEEEEEEKHNEQSQKFVTNQPQANNDNNNNNYYFSSNKPLPKRGDFNISSSAKLVSGVSGVDSAAKSDL